MYDKSSPLESVNEARLTLFPKEDHQKLQKYSSNTGESIVKLRNFCFSDIKILYQNNFMKLPLLYAFSES